MDIRSVGEETFWAGTLSLSGLRLRDATGLRCLDMELGMLLMWSFADWEIKVNRPYMFPCSVVPFALGVYGVAAQNGSLVDDCAWVCTGLLQVTGTTLLGEAVGHLLTLCAV